MSTVKCMIVDDEPIAIDILETYLQKVLGFELVASHQDPLEALAALREQTLDLLFLDIQMPELTGLQFLESLDKPIEVILTTAHREFALEGFEYNVVDYLLKPIAFERFLKATHRYLDRSNPPTPTQTHTPNPSLSIRVDRKSVRLSLGDIRYVEGLKDYIKIHTPHKVWVTKESISSFAERLSEDQFVRIHRSFIVALAQISAYTSQEVEVGKVVLPVGRTYKENVMAKLNAGSVEESDFPP
jgi:DNA-binding LytR/AlgR family response regulator